MFDCFYESPPRRDDIDRFIKMATPNDKGHSVKNPAIDIGLGGQPYQRVAIALQLISDHLAIQHRYINSNGSGPDAHFLNDSGVRFSAVHIAKLIKHRCANVDVAHSALKPQCRSFACQEFTRSSRRRVFVDLFTSRRIIQSPFVSRELCLALFAALLQDCLGHRSACLVLIHASLSRRYFSYPREGQQRRQHLDALSSGRRRSHWR